MPGAHSRAERAGRSLPPRECSRDTHLSSVGWWQPPRSRRAFVVDEAARHRAPDGTGVLPTVRGPGRGLRRVVDRPALAAWRGLAGWGGLAGWPGGIRTATDLRQARHRRRIRHALLGSGVSELLGAVLVRRSRAGLGA